MENCSCPAGRVWRRCPSKWQSKDTSCASLRSRESPWSVGPAPHAAGRFLAPLCPAPCPAPEPPSTQLLPLRKTLGRPLGSVTPAEAKEAEFQHGGRAELPAGTWSLLHPRCECHLTEAENRNVLGHHVASCEDEVLPGVSICGHLLIS